MHFSIAPVELTTQMRRQFIVTGELPRTDTPARHAGRTRHRVSAVLYRLAASLDPDPAATSR